MSSRKSKTANGLLWEGDIIHVVFNESAVEVLEKSFEIDDNILGDIVEIKDDFSVGSILDLSTPEGWQMRKTFWNSIATDNADEDVEQVAVMSQDKLTVHHINKLLTDKEDTNLWIWIGQNERDVCGYYWLLSQLKEQAGKLHVLHLNNLPFINEKGSIFYPVNIAEILPKELIKARRLYRQVSMAEIELDGDEWKKLCSDIANIRSLEGAKKIISRPDNFYDKDIVKLIGNDTFKTHRLIAHLSTKLKINKPELFWIWRLKHLAECNVLIANGDWSKLKDMSFKTNNGELFQSTETSADNIISEENN